MTEMVSNASPMMPSNLPTLKAAPRPDTSVISANCWSLTVKAPTVAMSCDTKPDTGPLPYWMLNLVPLATYVLDALESYSGFLPQSVHCLEGTHRLELPVSKTT